jgi:SAM-dependent methyltransferase
MKIGRNQESGDSHVQLILDRYKNRENIKIHRTEPQILVDRYLRKIALPNEFSGKTILEIGAGCSQYIPVFLGSGCAMYYANDIIPERLAATRSHDPRYVEISGDFRKIDAPVSVDIVFSTLTMMFVIPMLGEFVEHIHRVLKPGGLFIGMESNHICPLSIYRRFADRGPANPTRLFNPFTYARRFADKGFDIEKLVPFTAGMEWTTGNWVTGTNFWIRARKS